MNKGLRALAIIYVVLLLSPILSMAADDRIARVAFLDGGSLDVHDWNFVYRYGVKEQIFNGRYVPQWETTTDLLLSLGWKEERGVELKVDRHIPGADLKSIKYGNGFNDVPITLVDGEVIQREEIYIATRLLSDLTVFTSELYFKGTGHINGQAGLFSKRINRWSDEKPSEVIAEIQFLSSE